LIGLTAWRLRYTSANEAANSAKLVDPKNDSGANQLVAERVEAGTIFGEGERIRIGIEVPRQGYVYVINRAVYADGTMGEPHLIFPTKNLRGGDNTVAAGKLIEIPSQADSPPYFTLRQSRADQVSERLTLIVSPQRLNLSIAERRLKLDSATVNKWEKQWGGPVERAEARSGASKGWTIAEKEAGEGKRLLAENDPLPQTIYRVATRHGSPMVVVVPLRIAPK
jgi:hypothetical protein